MNQDDRVEQALDNFLTVFAGYYDSYFNDHSEIAQTIAGDAVFAYKQWLDASKPPGDPHKEWVDADKMKPECGNLLVLVKINDFPKAALGFWFSGRKSWRVQQYRNDYFDTQTGVTHWRYIPEMED